MKMVGLFRKKPQKDDTAARRKLKDFEEEEAPAEAEEAEETEDEETAEDAGVGVGNLKEMSEILGRLEEVEDKLGRIDSALTMLRNDTAQVKDRMNQSEQDMRKLLSVYEIVSAKFNPFIDVSDKAPEKATPQTPSVVGLELPPISIGGDLPEFEPYQEGESEVKSFKIGKQAESNRVSPPWEPETSTVVVDRGPVGRGKERSQPNEVQPRQTEAPSEREVRAVAKSKHNKKPMLAYIPHDYLSLVLVMRWIEFLFERVTRDKISLVLDYYVDVGWISDDVKSEIMSYARGEMQDVTKYMASEENREDVFREMPQTPPAAPYKKVEDWRMSADDHLKSLLFVQKIAGFEVDKDRLNSLEQNISKFKESLEGFHGV